MSTLFAILRSLITVKVYTVILRNSLISVYTICHSKQSDQGLHCLPFSAVWSGPTLFAILSSLIRVYTIRHSQQSDQGLLYLPFSAVWWGSTLFPVLSKQYFQGLHCLPFWFIWSGSTLIAFYSNLIRVYTVCNSQSDQRLHYLRFFVRNIIKVYTLCHPEQSDQGLQYLPFSAVRSGSTLFAILSSLISVYTICHYQTGQRL